MFHLKEIKDNILSFERDHDLSDWKYQGMDIWPILRSLVFVECRNELNSRQNAVKLDWLRKSKRKRVRSFLRNLKVKLAFRNKDLAQTEKRVSKSLKADPITAHAMFFGSWYFRTTFKGRFINKFFFPLTQIIENKFHLRSIEVEYSTGNKFKSEYKQISDEIEFIDAYELGAYDESRIKWLKNDSRFVGFFDSLSRLGVPKDLADIMAHKIEKIYRESFRFEQLFSKYQPKMAFCLTFFNEQMFAMLFAASKADVKSIDIGHGFPSDPENLIYSRFGDYPKEGYNTFPDFFWVWDEPVKEAMNQWIQGQNKHRVLVGGNPWLDFIIPTLSQESLSPKKVILYTLTVNRPEHFILDAMKKSQDRFEWWVRLHPAISLAKEEIREMLEKNGLTNFNLDEANRLQLPFLLKNCDVHISRNSSSIFESISMGNTPILIDEESINYYSSYIKKDLVKILLQENDQSLLLAIEQVLNKPKGKNQSSTKSLEALSFLFESLQSELPLKTLYYMADSDIPLVSISCLTYNHGKFLKEALDGFLIQKTDFPFEILIHDDASTDDTNQIILDYQKKYPDLIKPIFQEKNLWSQGTRALSATYNFPRAQGKYIAMCEGDDFWTDPYKLQKQVDFLENNPDYVACVHGAHFFDESLGTRVESKFEKVKEDFDLDLFKIFNESGGVYPSCSIVMRNSPPFYPKELLIFPSGDFTLIIFLKLKGKIRFMKGLWATYRIHSNGVYQGENRSIKNIIKNRYLIQEYYSNLSKEIPKSNIRGLLFLFKVKNYLSIMYLKMKVLVKPT